MVGTVNPETSEPKNPKLQTPRPKPLSSTLSMNKQAQTLGRRPKPISRHVGRQWLRQLLELGRHCLAGDFFGMSSLRLP